jgi:hypothetical protein
MRESGERIMKYDVSRGIGLLGGTPDIEKCEHCFS